MLTPIQYGQHGFQKEMEKRKLYAKDFASGLGAKLQERLKDLDHISANNWLDDNLWLALAYHTWRAPLIVNSNWWLTFKEDPRNPAPPVAPGATNKTVVPLDPNPAKTLPPGAQGGGQAWIDAHPNKKDYYYPVKYEDVTQREWITEWQVRRAAWLVSRFAGLRTMVQKEEVPPEASRLGPMCMNQYRMLFNISRIPLPNCDAFSAQDNDARHVTVHIADFVYSVDVFEKVPKGEIANPLPVGEIESLLQAAVADAKSRVEKGEKPAQVGILTADDRDTWVVNRERVLLHSPKNRASMDMIDRSLIGLSLDTYTLPTLPARDDPLRMAQVDAQMHNAQGGLNGGENRWFDKCLTVVVETNGRAAIMGEHSPVDALIPSYVVDYALNEPVDDSKFTGGKAAKLGEGFQREDFEISPEIADEIEACRARNQAILDDSDCQTLWWAEYGTDWIKKNGKVAPDAFVQQVLQLAWFRDQGYPVATYETASTRFMKHGRTDVIRSLSPESRAFVKLMQDKNASQKQRYDALVAATKEHSKLTMDSSFGKGYDRHMMGLKVQLRPGEAHPLFDDELYSSSQAWKLSTSGLSSGIQFHATGFGAPFADGYGINYMAGPNLIKFGLESKVSCDTSSTTRFKHEIVQAFRDMRELCEAQTDAPAKL